MENPYLPVEAKIEKVTIETPNIKTFVFKPRKKISFVTGQFVEVTVPGVGEAPFTPSSSPYELETIEVTVMDVGRVTNRLHQMKEGEIVGIRGPYGNGYPIDDFVGKEVYIVAGGVGLAPMRSLFLTLVNRIKDFKSIVCRLGVRTPDDFIYKDTLFGSWQEIAGVDIKLTVDEVKGDWDGNVGVVTTILKPNDVDIKNAVAVVCGPPIGMKYATLKLLEFGLAAKDIYLSMEKNMSCGIGKCGHCMLGKYYVCKDGPVFSYDMIKDIPETWD